MIEYGKKMTIFDAVEALELYNLYEDIIDAYEADFYAWSEIEADHRDLIEEHYEIYEFSVNEDEDAFGKAEDEMF